MSLPVLFVLLQAATTTAPQTPTASVPVVDGPRATVHVSPGFSVCASRTALPGHAIGAPLPGSTS